MIGRLVGMIVSKGAEGVLIDIGGVGYDVRCPLTVLDRLPPKGEQCTLFIHTHVREDQLALFGFLSADERELFRLLITISGIGPKTGLACLSGMSSDALANAIANEDIKRLSGIPGIGRRTAERVILELKQKVHGTAPGQDQKSNPIMDDLESALKNLGYRAKDVDKLTASIGEKADQMSFEELLREALKQMSRS